MLFRMAESKDRLDCIVSERAQVLSPACGPDHPHPAHALEHSLGSRVVELVLP